MSRFQTIDTKTGEIVGEYDRFYVRGYRRRTRGPWIERFLVTHEGQIAVAVLLGIIVGSSVHP